MRAKWNERRSACTRRGGASSTRSGRADAFRTKSRPRAAFLFWGQTSMVRAGIVGGTGYTGVELLRLLAQHPQVELRAITSRKEAGTQVSAMFPGLRRHIDLKFSEPTPQTLRGCDVVFFATPNGVAMGEARAVLDAGARIVDLSADFRIRDIAEWERWYKTKHAAPELVREAVYGLPEVNREGIRK